MSDPARPRHRGPLRARRGPAGRGRGPAQGAEGARRRVLVRLPQGGPGLHDRRLRRRHHLAGHRLARAERGRAGRGDPARGGRDRLVGHLDDRRQGGEPELRATRGWTTSPARRRSAAVAEYFGEAPANTKACDIDVRGPFCETYHAGDADYAAQIAYWTTPIEQCLDGRTDVKCTDYGDWTRPGRRSRADPRQMSVLSRRPGLRVGLLLTPPMLWLGVAYLGALAALLDHLAVDAERLHREHRARLDLRQLPRPVHRSRSTGRSPCARSGSRPWSR